MRVETAPHSLTDGSGQGSCGRYCLYNVTVFVETDVLTPIVDANVTVLTTLGSPLAYTKSSSDGKATFSEENGTYQVSASANGYSGISSETFSISGAAVSLDPLVLQANAPTSSGAKTCSILAISACSTYVIVSYAALGVILVLSVYFLVRFLLHPPLKPEGPEASSSVPPPPTVDTDAVHLFVQQMPPGAAPPGLTQQLPPPPPPPAPPPPPPP
jgi:hypothetical protein